MSVDLPAPLSPAMPTISPWRITKSTSVRASTAPYDLRSERASIRGVSRTALLIARAALDRRVHRDRPDEDPPDRDVLVEGVDVHEAQAVEDAPEDQRSEQRAENAAASAEEARPADHGSADRVQRNQVADVGR